MLKLECIIERICKFQILLEHITHAVGKGDKSKNGQSQLELSEGHSNVSLCSLKMITVQQT